MFQVCEQQLCGGNVVHCMRIDEEIEEWGYFMPGIQTGDIGDGTELRFRAYLEVWARCSLRIQVHLLFIARLQDL
jgi:hypothetical protein